MIIFSPSYYLQRGAVFEDDSDPIHKACSSIGLKNVTLKLSLYQGLPGQQIYSQAFMGYYEMTPDTACCHFHQLSVLWVYWLSCGRVMLCYLTQHPIKWHHICVSILCLQPGFAKSILNSWWIAMLFPYAGCLILWITLSTSRQLIPYTKISSSVFEVLCFSSLAGCAVSAHIYSESDFLFSRNLVWREIFHVNLLTLNNVALTINISMGREIIKWYTVCYITAI